MTTTSITNSIYHHPLSLDVDGPSTQSAQYGPSSSASKRRALQSLDKAATIPRNPLARDAVIFKTFAAHTIFSFLDAQDNCIAARTCRAWRYCRYALSIETLCSYTQIGPDKVDIASLVPGAPESEKCNARMVEICSRYLNRYPNLHRIIFYLSRNSFATDPFGSDSIELAFPAYTNILASISKLGARLYTCVVEKNYNPEVIAIFARQMHTMTNLKHLSLEFAPVSRKQAGLVNLTFPRLASRTVVHLDFEVTCPLHRKEIKQIATRFPALTSLVLRSQWEDSGTDDVPIDSRIRTDIKALFDCLPKLHSLVLDGMAISFERKRIERANGNLNHFYAPWRYLSHHQNPHEEEPPFDLPIIFDDDEAEYQSDYLESIHDHPSLTHLSLIDCVIDYEILKKLLKRLPNVPEVDISGGETTILNMDLSMTWKRSDLFPKKTKTKEI